MNNGCDIMFNPFVETVLVALKDGYDAMGLKWDEETAFRCTFMAQKCTPEQIKDMAGFVLYMKERAKNMEQTDRTDNWMYSEIIVNLMHDLNDLTRNEKCFLSRTHGYRKYLQKEGQHVQSKIV